MTRSKAKLVRKHPPVIRKGRKAASKRSAKPSGKPRVAQLTNDAVLEVVKPKGPKPLRTTAEGVILSKVTVSPEGVVLKVH